MAEINISGLAFRYPGEQAFEMTVSDLRIASGECVAIVGPSGSGKTTLLSLVAGIQVPQKGEIQIGETRVNQLGESDRRAFRIKEVGQVFQAFELLEYLSVIENVLLGSIIDPSIVKDARERAADLLASVGLSHKTHSKPAQLSHGERQRVAVCRAMLNDPKLLLADEPTGNLDQSNKQKVVDLLIKQAKQHHSTLLMVTHDNSLLDSFERVIDFEDLTRARS
jgi:putative ABC transport system ATP-binding protein